MQFNDQLLQEAIAEKPSEEAHGKYNWVFGKHKIWSILVLLIIIATIASSGRFISPTNIINVLFLAAPIGIAATGQTMVMLTGGIDLSVASVWTLAAVVGGTAAVNGDNPIFSLLIALFVGLLCGALNGWVIAFLRIPPLIATLGMLSMAEAVARIYSKDTPVMDLPSQYQLLGNSHLGILPIQTVVWFVVLLVMGYILKRTVFGRSIYAIGGNALAAEYSGLSVKGSLFTLYIITGVLAALAGTLQSAYLNIAPPNSDMSTLFDIIAGSVVGGTSLFGGEGSIFKTVAGVIVIVIIENVLRILGVSPLIFDAAVGVVIVIAVYLNVGLGKSQGEEKIRHKGI